MDGQDGCASVASLSQTARLSLQHAVSSMKAIGVYLRISSIRGAERGEVFPALKYRSCCNGLRSGQCFDKSIVLDAEIVLPSTPFYTTFGDTASLRFTQISIKFICHLWQVTHLQVLLKGGFSSKSYISGESRRLPLLSLYPSSFLTLKTIQSRS